jgi:hypothetical protein
MDKELRKIAKALEANGFETRVSRKGHLMAFRNGELVATFSGTASDWRSLKNSLAPLKRYGFDWPPKR